MRSPGRQTVFVASVLAAILVAGACGAALAADDPPDGNSQGQSRSVVDFIGAGGTVGYVIILLSFVGVALVIDGFLRLREDQLLPDRLIEQAQRLGREGKFGDIYNLCGTDDSMLSRIFRKSLEQGQSSLVAMRESLQEEGTREMTNLQQRIGYIGLIASIAPMLGLLGTVTGMIGSFDVLGTSKGAARPDDLAAGISEALVTTCMGLIVAVPLIFFQNFFRDRLTRIRQKTQGVCERMLRIITTVHTEQMRAEAAQRKARSKAKPDG